MDLFGVFESSVCLLCILVWQMYQTLSNNFINHGGQVGAIAWNFAGFFGKATTWLLHSKRFDGKIPLAAVLNRLE